MLSLLNSTLYYQYLFTQFGLALLDGRHHHVAHRRARHLIQAALDALDGDDVQVLRAGVVRAVHHRAHGARDGHLVLGAGVGATTCCA